MSYLRLLFITSIILLLGACGSSRKASQTGGAGTYVPAGDNDSGYMRWDDIRIPVNVNIEKPKSLRVSGTMTMVRDKSIHLSLRFFGMEVAAAYVTGDSVFAYAKMQRVYVAESIRDALGGVNATVGDVQSLLLGSPVSLPEAVGEATVTIIPSADIVVTFPLLLTERGIVESVDLKAKTFELKRKDGSMAKISVGEGTLVENVYLDIFHSESRKGIDELKKGDKVITAGGIYGTVKGVPAAEWRRKRPDG